MYIPVFWKDRIVEFPRRVSSVSLGNGLYEWTPAPGEICENIIINFIDSLRKYDRLFRVCGREFQRILKVYAYNLAAAGGNENLNKVEFEEGILYRYTLKIVQSSGKS